MRCAALLAVLVLAGCGGGDDERVTVGAAASLSGAFEACLDERVVFGGSDDIAAQIREGVGIDVFAAANTELPEQLAADGLAEDPVVFATNELVLAVPAGSDIAGLRDVRGRRVVVGSESVPVGAYTREVLAQQPAAVREPIEAAIRSEEPDVKSIVGKLATGAADAGFVYRTDVLGAGDDLRALPVEPQPVVEYGLAIVHDNDDARAVAEDILHGACAGALRDAGFGPPPA